MIFRAYFKRLPPSMRSNYTGVQHNITWSITYDNFPEVTLWERDSVSGARSGDVGYAHNGVHFRKHNCAHCTLSCVADCAADCAGYDMWMVRCRTFEFSP